MAKKVTADLCENCGEERFITKGDVVIFNQHGAGFLFFMVVPVSENRRMLANLTGQNSFMNEEALLHAGENKTYRDWLKIINDKREYPVLVIEKVIPHEEASIDIKRER